MKISKEFLDELDSTIKTLTQQSKEIPLDDMTEIDLILSLDDYLYWKNIKVEELSARVNDLDERIKKIESGIYDLPNDLVEIGNLTQEKGKLEDELNFYTTFNPNGTELVLIEEGCLISDEEFLIKCNCNQFYKGKLVKFEINIDTKRIPSLAMSLVKNKCPYCNRILFPKVDIVKMLEKQRDDKLKHIFINI